MRRRRRSGDVLFALFILMTVSVVALAAYAYFAPAQTADSRMHTEPPQSQADASLIITEPAAQTFETNEETIRFRGRYDPNYDVTVNGETILPTQSGEFIADFLLNTGKNTFVFRHKDKTVTYTIDRKIKVIRSVTPSAPITTDGGSRIIVKAVAYRGATLTATIGRYTVSLKETEGGDEHEALSSYQNYGGVFTAPAAKSYDDTIGSLRVTGKFKETTETVTGSSITVLKKETAPESGSDAQNEPTAKYDLGVQVETIADHTVVYDSDVTGAAYGSPEKHTLPAGTVDYIAGEVTENIYGDSVRFYKLRSGKKVKTSAVRKTSGKARGNNALSALRLTSSADYTTLSFQTKWRAGLDISFDGHAYFARGGYVYWSRAFTADSITVTFDYATVVPSLPDGFLSNNRLFRSARWSKTVERGIPKAKLHLTLRKKGGYYGCTVSYADDGRLRLKFVNPKSSLRGVKIVLDPGHGKGDSGAVGSYSVGGRSVIVYERDLNWKMALSVKKKLEAEGAQVYLYDSMSDDTAKGPSLSKRVAYGRAKQPMLYLALHHNSAGSASTGVETYYTNPFSKPLAAAINNRLGAYYNSKMYTTGDRNRGDKYSEFYVTRVHEYAAVLVEYGYVSNPSELKKLNSKAHREGLATATVNGIRDYLAK